MLKTTSDLLTSVNGRAFWPSTNGPYSDASILSIATEEIQGPLFTLLVESASELYANSTDITLVASQTGYRLPADAGYRLRDVTYIDGTGEENQLDIMPKDKLGMLDTVSVGRPRRFYLDGHKVHIWPKPPTSPVGSLRVKYFWQPNTLVSAGTTVSTATAATLNPSAAVAGWTTASGATWDVLADHGAHGLIQQFTGTYSAAPDITSLSSAYDDSELRAGDIVAQGGETHVPQVPTEVFPLLCQRVLVTCLAGHRDKTVLREQQEKLYVLEEQVVDHLERRVQGESMIFVADTPPLVQL